MKIVILTSNHNRHHFYVNKIAEQFNVVGAVREVKRNLIQESKNQSDSDGIMSMHLSQRTDAENKFFIGHTELKKDTKILDVEPGVVNSEQTFEFVKTLDPDIVLLFGTSIIKPPLLSFFDGRIVNMHLGLSPYYRGAATNFWPLVNKEPECVGATIHYATLKVDGGPILHQVRPEMETNDNAHDIGCKTIIAGVEGVIEVLKILSSQALQGMPQAADVKGRLYKRRDFSAESVQTLWKNLKEGMVREYLDAKEARDKAYPLISL